MPAFDDEAAFGAPPKKAREHTIGENLDAMSAPELRERIALCQREIERLEAAISLREATKAAASAFFKN